MQADEPVDGFECDPTIQDCALPDKRDFLPAHFMLWFLTMINGCFPILYWYLGLKKEVDKDAANKAILERNWWWFDTAIPLVVWGHLGLYGMAFFLGFFTFMGSKGMNNFYKWWMTTFVNYFGTLMHFYACLAFLAGAMFWVNQDLISVTRGWISAITYISWTVITFMWIGLTREKSFTYMYLGHCGEECYVEEAAEEDEAVEIADDVTTFQFDLFDF